MTTLDLPEKSETLSRPDNAFSQKVASILSTSYTDADIRKAIASLDSRLQENSGYSRRHLRYNTEAEVIASNAAALKDYSKLVNKLEMLGSTIDQLASSFNEMSTKASTNSNNLSSTFLNEATSLISERNNVKVRKMLLNSFKQKFIISPYQVKVLTSSSHPIDDEFFNCFQQVKKTHEDCQALLATEDQQMGLDIMSTTSTYLDKAYDRLFFTVQRDLKTAMESATNKNNASSGEGNKEDIELRKKLARSLAVLSERPNLFESAIQSLAESRNRLVSSKFIDALTVDTRIEKAIDFYAYDPLRYVGDMLAYVHSEIVGERETISGLFKYNDEYHKKEKEKKEEEEEEDNTINSVWSGLFNPEETTPQLLDKITSAMVKPLKARVENVIALETRVPTVYQLIDKIKFYESMYDKAFFNKTQLQNTEDDKTTAATTTTTIPEIIKCLNQLAEYGWRQFSKCLEENISDIKDNISNVFESTVDDLQPPEFLNEAMIDLKSVLKSYETSMNYTLPSIDDEEEEEEEKEDFKNGNNYSIKQIIQDMTEPFLECCNRIASDLPDNDSEIFTINCLDTVIIALQLFFTVTNFKIKQLQSRIEEISQVLLDRQYKKFLKESGLEPVMNDVNKYHELSMIPSNQLSEEEKNDIVELKRRMESGQLSKENLAELSFNLDNFLPSATMESTKFLFRLSSPRLGQEIIIGASKQFANDSSKLEKTILDIYNFEESKIYFPRTYMEVCVLLAIADDDDTVNKQAIIR